MWNVHVYTASSAGARRAMLGGGGMAEHEASAVTGGGGMEEQPCAVLGGGVIPDPERAGRRAPADAALLAPESITL
jgi:hypothetical protein